MLLAQKLEAEKGILSLYQQTVLKPRFKHELVELLKAQYLLELECLEKLEYLAELIENPTTAVMWDEKEKTKSHISRIEKACKAIEKQRGKTADVIAKKINSFVYSSDGDLLLKKARKEFEKWLDEDEKTGAGLTRGKQKNELDVSRFIHKSDFCLIG